MFVRKTGGLGDIAMSKWRQPQPFFQRPWVHQWLFLQAYVGLGIAWLVIHTLPFRWLSTRLGQRMAESSPDVAPEHVGFVQCVGWAVQRASGLTPWPSVCLPQAITAKMLLRQRGLASTLYMGAAFDARRDLTAHAWLRCGPIYVTGGRGHDHYGVVASFAENQGEGDFDFRRE